MYLCCVWVTAEHHSVKMSVQPSFTYKKNNSKRNGTCFRHAPWSKRLSWWGSFHYLSDLLFCKNKQLKRLVLPPSIFPDVWPHYSLWTTTVTQPYRTRLPYFCQDTLRFSLDIYMFICFTKTQWLLIER